MRTFATIFSLFKKFIIYFFVLFLFFGAFGLCHRSLVKKNPNPDSIQRKHNRKAVVTRIEDNIVQSNNGEYNKERLPFTFKSFRKLLKFLFNALSMKGF